MKEIWAELGYRGLFAGTHLCGLMLSKNTMFALLKKVKTCVFSTGFMPRVIKVAPACAVMISTYEFGKAFFQKVNLDREWPASWRLSVGCWGFLSATGLFTQQHMQTLYIRTVGTKSPQTEAWGTVGPGFGFVLTQKKRIRPHVRDASPCKSALLKY